MLDSVRRLALLGLLLSSSLATSEFPVTVDLDIISPLPGAVYENHGQENFPITFAIQNAQIADAFGYSFKWTIHSNVTSKLPNFYDEGASIGSSAPDRSVDLSINKTTIWQSLTHVFAKYESQTNYELDFHLNWTFTFTANCSQDSNGLSTSPPFKNVGGVIPFSTRPGSNNTPIFDVGGSSGNCAHRLQSIPILANLTNGPFGSCPELGDIATAVKTQSACGFSYVGQTTTGTQFDLTSSTTGMTSATTAATTTGSSNASDNSAPTAGSSSGSSTPEQTQASQTSASPTPSKSSAAAAPVTGVSAGTSGTMFLAFAAAIELGLLVL